MFGREYMVVGRWGGGESVTVGKGGGWGSRGRLVVKVGMRFD